MRRVAGMFLALALAACGGAGPTVTRVVDGRTMEGRFVMPVSYELFLRGSLAEEKGNIDEAIGAFEQAARFDPEDPLVWARLAGARCKKNPHDDRIEKDLARSLHLDPDFGPAHALATSCAGGGEGDARRALRAEPGNVDIAVAMQKFLAARGADADGRDRLVALTAEHPEVSSWRALFQWATAHGDDVLALASAKQLARSVADAPAMVDLIKSRAGDGNVAAARSLAAILLDQEPRLPEAAANPLVVRLAIDEALARADDEAATRRAERAHLSLAQVGARALALGQPAIATRLASLVARADPADTASRMVLAASGEAVADKKQIADAFSGATKGSPVPAEVVLVFARALARATTDADAHVFASGLPADLLGTDSVMVTLAVDLAARGAIAEAGLPNEARIELALRQRTLQAGEWQGEMDARHRLLALAWTRPGEAATRELALRLSSRSPRDPLVGAALVHIALATGQNVDGGVLGMLESLSPSDPIAIGAALDALKAKGSQGDLTAARARLAAIAATPAERALCSF